MSVMAGPAQLSAYLAERIRQAFEPGVPLPSERALAEQFRCARGTVRAAIAQLADDGVLETIPRQGHQLRAPQVEVMNESGSVLPNDPGRTWPILALLTFGRNFQDPHMLDAVGGAVVQARRESVHLLTMDIGDDRWVETLTTLESLHPGCQVDGYILMGKPPLPVRQLLEKSVKPCVFLGTFYGETDQGDQGRFLRVATPHDETNREVARHLLALGHRRILVVTGPSGKHAVGDRFRNVCREQHIEAQIDDLVIDTFDPRRDFMNAALEAGDQVMARLADHTALFVNFGGYAGLDIWKKLQDSGRRIPEDLSVILGGGRFDMFVDVYDIATIQRSAFLEGEVCVREAARQIRSGRVTYGVKHLGQEYLARHTVGPAPQAT